MHAKQLFAACLELVTEFSPKLRQVMLNEMLLLDIYTHEAGPGASGERPPSDLISRVRGYLEMRVPGEYWRSWDAVKHKPREKGGKKAQQNKKLCIAD